MSRIKNIFLALAILLSAFKLTAQNYPVQSFVQITPPFSSYLPDYADPFNNQMKILLTLTDFTVPSYQVRVRITIQGNGYSIVTNEFVNLPPITVTPGVPVEISGASLAPYLATENLVFTGINVNDYVQRKVLPEGPCTICVEVIDFTSPNNTILGNPACSQAWFARQQPPLLNQPFCGTSIQETTPQQILFAWTPLNMGDPLGTSTEYVFELFEDNSNPASNIDPNQIVNSTLPIFIQTTNQTFINYGIVEPQLRVAKNYIWRIQARNTQGRDLYENNGYSAVCTFTYGSLAASLADGIVLQLQTNGTGTRQGTANWNANSIFDNYILEVRKTGNSDFEWFQYPTNVGEPTSSLKINSLEPSTEYEGRIKGIIGSDYESDYSNTSTFTTNPAPNYACGSTTMPATSPNIVPLDNAIAGMVFTVGQFDMRVTSITPLGQAGHFKGTGRITMPFVGLNLNVSYGDILVDENLSIRTGKVEAITKGIGAWENDILLGQATPIYVNDIDTTGFVLDSNSLTINLNGIDSTLTFPGGGVPLVFNVAGGKQYIVWPDGTIDIGTWGTISNDSLDATKDYYVEFKKVSTQKYGFDAFDTKYQAWAGNYENIILSDGTPYYVAHKSSGWNTGDKVKAILHTNNSPLDITFTIGGSLIEASKVTIVDNKTFIIDLDGEIEDFSKDLYAFDTDNKKIGKLRVIAYEEKTVDLVIVPVDGATINLPQLQDSLNKIYAPANTKFNVTVAGNYSSTAWDLNSDGAMQVEDPALFNLYSDEMKSLRSTYFADSSHNKSALYVFVVNNFNLPSVKGYMVHNKALGFVKNNPTARTIAHEIGHGAFDLGHTFPEITEGGSDNLMDYGNGNELTKVQWEQIFTNQLSFSFLDGAEDGQMANLVLDEIIDFNTILNSSVEKQAATISNSEIYALKNGLYFSFDNESKSKIDRIGFSQNGYVEYFITKLDNTYRPSLISYTISKTTMAVDVNGTTENLKYISETKSSLKFHNTSYTGIIKQEKVTDGHNIINGVVRDYANKVDDITDVLFNRYECSGNTFDIVIGEETVNGVKQNLYKTVNCIVPDQDKESACKTSNFRVLVKYFQDDFDDVLLKLKEAISTDNYRIDQYVNTSTLPPAINNSLYKNYYLLRKLRPNFRPVILYFKTLQDRNGFYSKEALETMTADIMTRLKADYPDKVIMLHLINGNSQVKKSMFGTVLDANGCSRYKYAISDKSYMGDDWNDNILNSTSSVTKRIQLAFNYLKKPYHVHTIFESLDYVVHQTRSNILLKTSSPDVSGLPFIMHVNVLESKRKLNYDSKIVEIVNYISSKELRVFGTAPTTRPYTHDPKKQFLRKGAFSEKKIKEMVNTIISNNYSFDESCFHLQLYVGSENAYTNDIISVVNKIFEIYNVLSEPEPEVSLSKTAILRDWATKPFSFDALKTQTITSPEKVNAYFIGVTNNEYDLKWDVWFNNHPDLVDSDFINGIDGTTLFVDPVIYGAADIIGMLPVVDVVGDVIGVAYATARGHTADAVLYGVAVPIAIVSGAELKLLKKFVLTVKKGANSIATSSFVLKNIDAVEIDDIIVGSAIKAKNATSIDKVSAIKSSIDLDHTQKVAKIGLAEAGSAKFGKYFVSSLTGFSDDIASLASKQGLSIDDFKVLQQKRYDVMTPLEQAKVDAIRNAIPLPDGNTILQKAIPKSDIPKYLRDIDPYYQVGGFVTTAKDAKHLSTFEDVYYGMRLDYEGTAFNLSDGGFGVIRYKTPTPNAQVPRITSPQDKFPFTGNGFTSGNNGKLGVPEWKTPYNTPVDGAELWEVASDGTETLKAIFNTSQNKFIAVP